MNTVNLVGNNVRDIELRQTTNDKAVAKFSIAVRRDKDNADFINCVAFGKTAELLNNFVKKGDKVGVSGRIQTGSYEKDGQKVYTTDVVVSQVTLIGNPAREIPKGNPVKNFEPTFKEDDPYAFMADQIDEDLD
jgi:single-strand DNA-binding protein